MIGRFGNVVYWACVGSAALIFAGVAAGVIQSGDFIAGHGVATTFAVLLLFFGRAMRYILTGR